MVKEYIRFVALFVASGEQLAVRLGPALERLYLLVLTFLSPLQSI
jgi:hypothetical protein